MAAEEAVTLVVVGATDVGLRRQRNEDSVRWHVPAPGTPESAFGAVMLVCDGMGGVGKGDLASQTAIEHFFRTYYDTSNPELDTQARVQTALEAAHDAVREAASALGMLYIGTTAAGLVMRNDGSALSFNLGDSRVYRLRGDEFTLISKDQSVNAAQLERGEISPEQAARNNMNITAFIGHPLELDPIYVPLQIQQGDVYLLCSDGLWDIVRDPQLRETLLTTPPERAVKHLIDSTLKGGAPDNVTAIIASTRVYAAKRRWWLFALPVALLLIVAVVLGVIQAQQNGNNNSIIVIADASQTEAHSAEFNLSQPANLAIGALDTATLTSSNTPTATSTPSNIPTDTDTPTDAPTDTRTPTRTLTNTPTDAPTRRPSRTPTPTPTPTRTATSSITPTWTPSRTASLTRTPSPTVTQTATDTSTWTPTGTNTATALPTDTPTRTPTATATPSATPTDTARPSSTPALPPTSTLSVSVLLAQGTPTEALETVLVMRYESQRLVPTGDPVHIYRGDIVQTLDGITMSNPVDPGSQFMLVQVRDGVLPGSRFWWLVEEVTPQLEVLAESGITVRASASLAATAVSVIPADEIVVVTGISPDGRWFRIRWRGGPGWVARLLEEQEFIRFIGDIDDVTVVTPPRLTPTPDGSVTPEGDETPESPPEEEPTAETPLEPTLEPTASE